MVVFPSSLTPKHQARDFPLVNTKTTNVILVSMERCFLEVSFSHWTTGLSAHISSQQCQHADLTGEELELLAICGQQEIYLL